MRTKTLSLILISVLFLFSCSREQRNKKAEEKGQRKVEKQASFIKGIGEGMKGLGKDAIESVSEGVGEIVKGANEGLDKSFVKIDIRVSEELAPLVQASRCEIHQNDSSRKKGVLVYTIFEDDFDGRLVLKAFDKENNELGRSAIAVTEAADNGHFIEFPFDERTSFTLINYLTLEHRAK